MESHASAWKDLCLSYTDNTRLIGSNWKEISKAYQAKGRHYHNLQHLADLLTRASEHQSQLQDYDSLCFSIFYHDIVYCPLRKDNEPKSAALARRRMQSLNVPAEKIERCVRQIEATRTHLIPEGNSDPDLPWFLDFDLSILGSDWERYHWYTQQIRLEYRIYPGWMYRKGRTKVLTHFLERDRLFFTGMYFKQFEEQARRNLIREIEMLKG